MGLLMMKIRQEEVLDGGLMVRVKDLINVNGHSYRLRVSASVTRKRVILVDDIVTTGASMAACTEELLGGGALSVIGVSVSRVREKKRKKQK